MRDTGHRATPALVRALFVETKRQRQKRLEICGLGDSSFATQRNFSTKNASTVTNERCDMLSDARGTRVNLLMTKDDAPTHQAHQNLDFLVCAHCASWSARLMTDSCVQLSSYFVNVVPSLTVACTSQCVKKMTRKVKKASNVQCSLARLNTRLVPSLPRVVQITQ